MELVRKVVRRQDRLAAQMRQLQGAEQSVAPHKLGHAEHLSVSPTKQKPVVITVRST